MSINVVRRSETRASASARPSVDLVNNTQIPSILNVNGIKLSISESRVIDNRSYGLVGCYALCMKRMLNLS